MVEEGRALLVRDTREGIIGVLTLEIRDQLGVFVVFAELSDAVRQRFPTDESTEITNSLVVVDGSLDTSFQIDSPAFVEPEVLPAGAALRIIMSAHSHSGKTIVHYQETFKEKHSLMIGGHMCDVLQDR